MISASPSFSSPSIPQGFATAATSSPQPPSWNPSDTPHSLAMSHSTIDPHFSPDHMGPTGFHTPIDAPFGAHFQPHIHNPCGPAPVLVQPSMYASHDPASFWKPDPNNTMVKLEPGADIFSTAHIAPQFSFPGSQPMMASMSLPAYTTHPMDSRFTFSDAESIASVPSPSSTSDASTRPGSAKRGAKRKQNADASLDSASQPASDSASKATKKASRPSAQRRPPPSASHVTEAGKPFPVIDTSAKHSSLFVPPDTSGLTKREARLVKNRAAAFLSRQRKREQFEEMELKCRGISMLVWRMWEAIAGTDAGLDRVDASPLAAVLANEDPMARLCLEEVITKKGASIAPTADELEGSPAPEALSARRPSVVPAQPAGKDADAASAQLERVRADLAASHEREKDLARQLDAMRASLAAAASMPMDHPVGVAGFEPIDVNAAQSGLASRMAATASQPFKAVQGAELPLFVPESPLSKFTNMDAAMPDAAHAAFSLSKTPTLATFSETAMRNRSAHQPFVADKLEGFGMGLGLDYKFPTASLPSSPSTASSSSHESHHARHLSLPSTSAATATATATAKAPSTLASVLLLAGMSLMGAGPTESATSTARPASRKPARVGRKKLIKDNRAADDLGADNDGEPSSHLSDDDLLMEMGLDSASMSEADDDDANEHAPAAGTKAAASAPAVSCA